MIPRLIREAADLPRIRSSEWFSILTRGGGRAARRRRKRMHEATNERKLSLWTKLLNLNGCTLGIPIFVVRTTLRLCSTGPLDWNVRPLVIR